MHFKNISDIQYLTGLHPLIREQLKKGKRPSEFGNKVWAVSHTLIEYLTLNQNKWHGLRVLEIGCGWGLIGIFLAKRFSCSVTCSDLDLNVFPIVELQAQANKVKVQTYHGAFSELSKSFLSNFDLVIGAEICYSESVSEEVSYLIQRAMEAGVNHVIVADPGRPDFIICAEYCRDRFNTNMILLPGTINGKATHILKVTNQNH